MPHPAASPVTSAIPRPTRYPLLICLACPTITGHDHSGPCHLPVPRSVTVIRMFIQVMLDHRFRGCMLGRMSVNRFLRLKLELVPVVIVAAGSLLGSAGGSGTVAAALSAQPRPSHLEIVKVPVSSVPASVRARLPRG